MAAILPPPPPTDVGATAAPPAAPTEKAAPPPPKSKNSLLLAVLPLGIGQLQNHAYLKAGFFFIGEATSLYFYQSNIAVANKVADDTNAYSSARSEQEKTLPAGQVDAFHAETVNKVSERIDYVTKTRQTATYCLISFGVLWGAGVADAIINEPPPTKPKKKKKKSGFSLLPREYGLGVLAQLDMVQVFNLEDTMLLFDWQNKDHKPEVALTIGTSF